MKTISIRQFNREVTTLAEPVNVTVRTVMGEIRNLGTFYPIGVRIGVIGGDAGEYSVIPGKMPSDAKVTPGSAPRSTTITDTGRFGASRPAPKGGK